jgi:hypothetical protein
MWKTALAGADDRTDILWKSGAYIGPVQAMNCGDRFIAPSPVIARLDRAIQ